MEEIKELIKKHNKTMTDQQQSKLLSKFELYRGYSSNHFDGEDWTEFDAYEEGYKEALKDINIEEISELLDYLNNRLQLGEEVHNKLDSITDKLNYFFQQNK